MKKFLGICAVIGILILLQIYFWCVQAGPLTQTAFIRVEKGTSLNLMADGLKREGIIAHPFVFKIIARFSGLSQKLRAGEYKFEPEISLWNVMQKIAKGDVFYRKITLAEGLTNAEIMRLLNDNPYLSGETVLNDVQGSILPETYTFPFGTERQKIIREAQADMQKTLDEAWNMRDLTLPIKNKQELLILASIIEKETGVPEERPLVASVFVNRLKKGMKLQTDPTVIFALTQGKSDLGRTLKRKDLQVDSPYNTYKYYGLPPEPICNPGKDAIFAAAQPAKTDYLFFVATGDGGHNFSKSLSEHNKNVKSWVKKISK